MSTDTPTFTLDAIWHSPDEVAVMVTRDRVTVIVRESRIDGLLARVVRSDTGTVQVGTVTLDESDLIEIRSEAVRYRARCEAEAVRDAHAEVTR